MVAERHHQIWYLLATMLLALGLAVQQVGAQEVEPPETAPPERLQFTGNEEETTASIRNALAEDIDRARRKGYRKAVIDDLAFEIELLLQRRGYAFADVTYEYAGNRSTFVIDEGPRVLLFELKFRGNDAVDDDDLAPVLRERRTAKLGLGARIFAESDLGGMTSGIRRIYEERGFHDVEVEPPVVALNDERTRARITTTIIEGPRYILSKIDHSAIQPDPESGINRDAIEARLRRLEGSGYVPRMRLEVQSACEDVYAANGYREAIATVRESIDRSAETEGRIDVTLTVSVERGNRVRIGQVRIRGNERTRGAFIRNRVLLKSGRYYDIRDERRSFSRLFATGIFRSIEFELVPPGATPWEAEIQPQEDVDRASDEGAGTEAETPTDGVVERDLIVYVVERSTVDTFFELGWGSYEKLRATIGVRERNLFGTGMTGRAEALGSDKALKFTLGLTNPWTFGTEWTTDIPLTYERRTEPSFDLEEAGVRVVASRKTGTYTRGGLEYRFELSEVTAREAGAIPEEETGVVQIGALGPFLEYDSRNDLFSPTRGLRARAYGEIGAKALGGEITFYHTGGSASSYLALADKTVLAGIVRSDWIVPFGDTDAIPIQERLFLGGENGVRSFKQSDVGPKDDDNDPLGGEVRNFLSLELRQRLAGALGVAAFFDYGNVSTSHDNPFRDFRPGVGIGLRYSLPIGPLRLDAAYNPDHRDKEDHYVVHFAVGMPF